MSIFFRIKPKVRIRPIASGLNISCSTEYVRHLSRSVKVDNHFDHSKQEAIRTKASDNRSTLFTETLELQQPNIQSDLRDFVENKDELQIKLSSYLESKPEFINAYETFKKKNLQSTTTEEAYSFEPFHNFKQILDSNLREPPDVGSLVEFISTIDNTVHFGLVIRKSQSKFNEAYNKSVVLTIDNNIELVSATHINFHSHRVVDPEWVESMHLLEDRSKSDTAGRSAAITTMESFLSQSLILSDELESDLSIVNSQYAQLNNLVSISVLEIIESLKLTENLLARISKSYFQQSILIMAIHLNIVKSPYWVNSSSLPNYRSTNLVEHKCSNELIYGSNYYVNSISNNQAISKLMGISENRVLMEELNEFFSNLASEQRSSTFKKFDDLNFYLNIWEGRHFSYALSVLKFCVVYPHPKLMNSLRTLDVFKKEKYLNSTHIYNFLEKLKLYNNSQNQLTDIFLSANIMGKSKLGELAISSVDQVESHAAVELKNNLVDKYPHLRKSRQYYRDHVVYGIPYLSDQERKNSRTSYLGVSLEKINSRKYTINFHIPDIVTKIAPSGDLFNSILSSSFKLRSVVQLLGDTKLNTILDESLVKQMVFSNSNVNDETDWMNVGDISLQNADNSGSKLHNTTCMTVSMIYNTFDSEPFSNLEEKISISFDSLSSVEIKIVDWSAFEESLNGKSELSPFRIFKRKSAKDSLPQGEGVLHLNQDDHHNLGFIYNVLKSHFKVRNLEGASITNPLFNSSNNDSSDMAKELSFVNRNTKLEKMVTKIERVQKSLSETFSKSKFFINESECLIDKLTSEFCTQKMIPVFTHYQEPLDETTPDPIAKKSDKQKDSVLVSHNNLLLPNYHAESFYQTLISRDAQGYVSVPAHFIGRNYLSRPSVDAIPGNSKHLPMGVSKGLVKTCDVFHNFEVIFNHLQILNFIQLQEQNTFVQNHDNHIDMIQRFSYLKGYGYNINGPYDASIVSNQANNIMNSSKLASYLQAIHKRFWTLKMLEQKLLEETFIESTNPGTTYECVVTHCGYLVPDLGKRIARGFCRELAIEVDLLISLDHEINIGSVVNCAKVLHFDAVKGSCILKEEQVF